ncbi:4Fe-4S dicluster domain-containing protein [candidate division KSB1 bacterium]|nr:4Fe-4S dicluster domain-containing protein [candidate division KSB1 bacterium]
MAHHTLKNGYSALVERLNRFPQGAPPSDALYKILKIFFSEQEAGLIALLPIKPFTAAQAGRIWKTDAVSAQKTLDSLAGRALLVDREQDGQVLYVLPPPMAGFFEFSLMRVRKDIDQKLLSELFYQYISQEDDFMYELLATGETKPGRAFVHEPALSEDNALHVLDYERSTQVIESASDRAIGLCYCRHKMAHLGRACKAPQDICMTFNSTATALVRHGFARRIDTAECLELLAKAWEHNLVQFGENVRQRVSFICNCCGCCCEAMIAARRFAVFNPIHTTNFIPQVENDKCTGCGKCVDVCPVEAMTMVSANDPSKTNRKTAKVNVDICLGCGVCVRICSKDALSLKMRESRVLTPVNGAHRIVLMAIERGKLQHLIFDNRILWSHRALAVLLGVLLHLPPLKQAIASRQVRSLYLEKLLSSR